MYKNLRYYWYGVAFVIWFFVPVISIFIFLYLINQLSNKSYPFLYYIFLISLTFGLIAYTGYPSPSNYQETDIARYYVQFEAFSQISTLIEFFIVFLNYGGILYSGFNIIVFILSQLFPDIPQTLPLFWITITYLFLSLFVIELTTNKKSLFFVLFCLLLFGTTFFIYEFELLKQSAATAMTAYALSRRVNQKKYSGIFFALSVIIHPSMLIFLLAFFFYKKLTSYFSILLLGGAIILAIVDINSILGSIFEKFSANADLYKIINVRPIIHYVILLLYTLIIVLIFIDKKGNKNCAPSLLNICFILYCIFLSQFGSIHNFGRYLYLYSPFYILSLYVLFLCHYNRKDRSFVIMLFSSVFVIINLLFTVYTMNSDYTNIFMNNSLYELLTSNVYSILTTQWYLL